MALYTHIFFDLDRTLWDFDRNSRETLSELVQEYRLSELGVPGADTFIANYEEQNDLLWAAYRRGEITKEVLRVRRFEAVLAQFGIWDKELAEELGMQYIERSPRKVALLPDTLDLLTSLKDRYELHIITNGFEEVQHVKLEQSKLAPFFNEIITSERAGVKKPDPGIFELALQETGASAAESLMVGDDVHADMVGAKKAGLDQAWFNPRNKGTRHKLTYIYQHHAELMDWL